jgi:hypothetical protein
MNSPSSTERERLGKEESSGVGDEFIGNVIGWAGKKYESAQ